VSGCRAGSNEEGALAMAVDLRNLRYHGHSTGFLLVWIRKSNGMECNGTYLDERDAGVERK